MKEFKLNSISNLFIQKRCEICGFTFLSGRLRATWDRKVIQMGHVPAHLGHILARLGHVRTHLGQSKTPQIPVFRPKMHIQPLFPRKITPKVAHLA